MLLLLILAYDKVVCVVIYFDLFDLCLFFMLFSVNKGLSFFTWGEYIKELSDSSIVVLTLVHNFCLIDTSA
jgi:hypothetical protein